MPGGSTGRRPKARKALLLAGTFREDRHGAHDTPDPPKGRPDPPKPLNPEAQAEWDRMVARMEQMGTLSAVDDAALYQYCCLFAETEARVEKQATAAASAQILEDNLSGLQGAEIVACFQEITKVRQLESGYDNKIRQDRMALRQMLVEFGLTPAARSRVKLPAKPAKSKVEQFLEAARA